MSTTDNHNSLLNSKATQTALPLPGDCRVMEADEALDNRGSRTEQRVPRAAGVTVGLKKPHSVPHVPASSIMAGLLLHKQQKLGKGWPSYCYSTVAMVKINLT